jgi:hypothetical protein
VQFEVRAARSCHCDNSDRGHNLHSPAICGAYRAAAVYLIHSYRWLPLRLHLIWRDILHRVHYPPMA